MLRLPSVKPGPWSLASLLVRASIRQGNWKYHATWPSAVTCSHSDSETTWICHAESVLWPVLHRFSN